MLNRISWLRIAGAAILMEIVLFAIALSLNASANGPAVPVAALISLCVIGTFIGGWWAASRLSCCCAPGGLQASPV
jgi:hypothetical protein